MEHDAAYELHAVVDHVPGDFITACHPVVFPYGIVAVDGDEVLALCGKFAVEPGGFYGDGLVGSEACGGFADNGEHFGEMLVELVLDGVEDGFLVAVDFIPHGLTLVEGEFLHLDFESGVFLGFLRD